MSVLEGDIEEVEEYYIEVCRTSTSRNEDREIARYILYDRYIQLGLDIKEAEYNLDMLFLFAVYNIPTKLHRPVKESSIDRIDVDR